MSFDTLASSDLTSGFSNGMQGNMELDNPVFAYPSMLDVDYDHVPDADEEPRAGDAAQSNAIQDTASLTDSDASEKKGGGRKDSKRGSGTATPRDGVTGFLHDDEASHSMTHSGQSVKTPSTADSSPKTPKAKQDPNTHSFDRKSLLSAKGVKNATIDVDADDATDVRSLNLIENLYHVQDRSEASTKRRTVHDEGHDEKRKKQKFEITGGSGVMSEFIKDEKAKDVVDITDASGVAAAIDLTDDIAPIKPEDDKIVLLGKIEVNGRSPSVNMDQVPHLNEKSILKESAKQWPPIVVRFAHEKAALICVKDPSRQRFGYLDGYTATAIAPFFETDAKFSMKGTLLTRKRRPNEHAGDGISQTANVMVKIYALKSRATWMGKILRRKKIEIVDCIATHNEELYNPHSEERKQRALAPLGYAGYGGSGYALSSTRTVEEVKSDVMNMFDTIIQTEEFQEAEQPEGVVTEMLSHQKQALFFLKNREQDRNIAKEGSEPFHLWKVQYHKNGNKVWYNVITGTETDKKPPTMRGGILADTMGLGKTLSMLSLAVDSFVEAKKFSACKPPLAMDSRLRTNSRATLLICPLTVVANWEIQIKEHIRPNAFNVHVFHGANRLQDFQELSDHDMVITSYGTIAAELKRSSISPLYRINWFRIILDEAHIIRNAATMVAKAVCELNAERRWAVTGTPVQNRLDDLGSLLKFLRLKPFDDKGAFGQYILAPFKTADIDIIPKIRLLVDSITLRRLKNNIDLPGRQDLITRLDFSKEEEDLYRVFVNDSKSKVQLLSRADSMGGKSYAQILKAISRLRLICAHGEELLNDEDRKLLEGLTKSSAIDLTDDDDDDNNGQLTKKQAFDMLELLRTSSMDNCPRCDKKIAYEDDVDEDEEDDVRGDTNTLGHMTACFHIVCPKCFPAHCQEIEDRIAEEIAENEDSDGTTYTCAYCRDENIKFTHYPILRSELEEEAEQKRRIRANPKLARQMGFYKGPHTKTKHLIAHLKEFESESQSRPSEPPIKSVIFSTWTSHLDLIQIALTANNITYARLDGGMSRRNRTAAIDEFTNNPDTTVILITIGAGGLGLNLTAGSKVFVMEPQFNPAAEQQAVDRVHRLGQTREVTIYRLIMRGSFEENMLAQQEKKIELANLTVNRTKKMDKAEAARERLKSLQSLFK